VDDFFVMLSFVGQWWDRQDVGEYAGEDVSD
jgi:hypothetical protein